MFCVLCKDAMVERSLACLKEALHNITNTYVTALLSYTFTLAGDEQMRQNLLSNLDTQAKREGNFRLCKIYILQKNINIYLNRKTTMFFLFNFQFNEKCISIVRSPAHEKKKKQKKKKKRPQLKI